VSFPPTTNGITKKMDVKAGLNTNNNMGGLYIRFRNTEKKKKTK